MLNKYNEFIDAVGPCKKFRNKRAMFQHLSDLMKGEGWNKSAVQVENRFKTAMKQKKNAVTNNKRSGFVRETVPYEEEIDEISRKDDSIIPDYILGIGQSDQLKSEPQRKRQKQSLPEVLLKINELKEKEKERRHMEKMDLLEKLLSSK